MPSAPLVVATDQGDRHAKEAVVTPTVADDVQKAADTEIISKEAMLAEEAATKKFDDMLQYLP